jgi:hypothetical protein
VRNEGLTVTTPGWGSFVANPRGGSPPEWNWNI